MNHFDIQNSKLKTGGGDSGDYVVSGLYNIHTPSLFLSLAGICSCPTTPTQSVFTHMHDTTTLKVQRQFLDAMTWLIYIYSETCVLRTPWDQTKVS